MNADERRSDRTALQSGVLTMRATTLLLATFALLMPAAARGETAAAERWKEISAIPDRKTHLVPSTWNLDKYPDAPLLTARSRVTLLDQDGPGVVTQIHVSDYLGSNNRLVLRVWYDREAKPSIEMPLMEFLGDIESATPPYQTIYFSRVNGSHNFRLPMPFRKHVTIEVENPSDAFCFGYAEVQWDEVKEIPATCGYLKADFRAGTMKYPHEDLVLCDILTAGTLVAHWLQLTGDHPSCAGGQGTCEANHEVYLDGDTKPTVECLGAEDFYGHSWGFRGLASDSHAAIIRYDKTPQGGTRVAMIRARDTDRISFRTSCRIVLTYKHDLGEPYNPATRKGKAPALQPFVGGATLDVPYRSCIYYYVAK
jgi:hypothetical protein